MAIVKYRRPKNSFLYNVAKGASGLIKYGAKQIRTNAGLLPIASAASSYLAKGSTQENSRDITGSILTNQHDSGARYMKRRMPRRRRRAFVRQVKKFQWMVQKQQPLLSWTKFYGFRMNQGSNDLQSTNRALLYPINCGTNETDLRDIIVAAYGGVLSDHNTKRIFIKSAVIDMQIKNNASDVAVVDIYKIVATGLPYQSAGVSLNSIWSTLYLNQTGAASSTSPALTPFQNPEFCKYFRVVSKKEVLLGAGNTTTMQMRIPGNRVVYGRQLVNAGATYPRLTMGFLLQVRSAPTLVASNVQLAPHDCLVSVQKTYTYGLPPTSTLNETINV